MNLPEIAPTVTGTHKCPGGCNRDIPNRLLACAYHWHRVPASVKNTVNVTWSRRNRNPQDAAAVSAHQAAVRRAIGYMVGGQP